MTQVNPMALAEVLKSEKNNRGGNITVRSKSSGKDFTYRIARSEFSKKWYTHIYIETQYLQFRHIGIYKNQGIFKGGIPVVTPAAQGASWLLRMVEKGAFKAIEAQADVFHTGRCLKCNKELTDARSIEIGLGPVCRSY